MRKKNQINLHMNIIMNNEIYGDYSGTLDNLKENYN